MNREMADRARDTRAIEIQGRQIGGSDVSASVHLHAGEDRKKVFSAQRISLRGPGQCTSHQVARMAIVERLDLLMPRGQSCELVFDRPLAIGDVVDLTAERVDRVHAVTAVPRQQPHRPVERGPGSLDPMPDVFAQRLFTQVVGGGERRVAPPRKPLETLIAKAAMKSDLRSATRVATGSPRRRRRSSRPASSTMTADSHRNPREATSGGKLRAWSINVA